MFISIFLDIIIPVFVIIFVGYLLDRKFRFDMQTLANLNFYVFVPAFIFVKIVESNIQPANFVEITFFTVIHFLVLYVFCFLFFSGSFFREKKAIMTIGTLFHNAGNYGIPLIMLAFGNIGVSVIAVILMIQNLFCFTFGIFLMQADKKDFKKITSNLLKIPVIYAIAIAFIIRFLELDIPRQLSVPMNYLSDGLIAVALLTLGAQLSRSSFGSNLRYLSPIVGMRLVISPLTAFLLLHFFNFSQPVSHILVVSSGLPVAVNAYILAAEYKNEPELAAQMVFWSTVISALTIPAIFSFLR